MTQQPVELDGAVLAVDLADGEAIATPHERLAAFDACAAAVDK